MRCCLKEIVLLLNIVKIIATSLNYVYYQSPFVIFEKIFCVIFKRFGSIWESKLVFNLAYSLEILTNFFSNNSKENTIQDPAYNSLSIQISPSIIKFFRCQVHKDIITTMLSLLMANHLQANLKYGLKRLVILLTIIHKKLHQYTLIFRRHLTSQ